MILRYAVAPDWGMERICRKQVWGYSSLAGKVLNMPLANCLDVIVAALYDLP